MAVDQMNRIKLILFTPIACDPADLPRNVTVTYDEKHGPIQFHEYDVVCLVKRNAADETLCQDSWPHMT